MGDYVLFWLRLINDVRLDLGLNPVSMLSLASSKSLIGSASLVSMSVFEVWMEDTITLSNLIILARV